MKISCIIVGFLLGFITSELYVWIWPLSHCIVIPGIKGVNGGGDSGAGIFCKTGFVIMPGKPGVAL